MTMKKNISGSSRAILVFAAISFSSTSYANESQGGEGDHNQQGQEYIVQGVLGTGANILGDQPYWNFGDPWGALTFSAVGGFNPDGNDPLPLTQDTPMDTVLVSLVDDQILDEIGYVTAVPQNTPLRQNYTAIDGSGDRGQIPAVTDTKGYEQSKSLPNDAITVREWVKAKGEAKFTCYDDGIASVEMQFNGLLANGLYSIWATYGDPNTGGFAPVPLGGTPNIIVPGTEGEARYERYLNDCPLTPVEGEKPLLLIEVAYHSDGLVYGAVADLPGLGYPFGLTTHTQINFPVNIVGNAN